MQLLREKIRNVVVKAQQLHSSVVAQMQSLWTHQRRSVRIIR